MLLSPMFRARSVAVVGASASTGKTGNTILKNIVEGGFSGEIYPVNPKGGEILGLKVYPGLAAVGRPVDLVVVVVPAPAVPGVIADVRATGSRSAVLITGGFAEVGNVELESEVVAEARAAGIPVLGPNCQGLNYTPNNLCATWPLYTLQGPLAVISQSGTVGAALSGWAEQDGLGISGFAGLGNKADVSEIELLRFFGEDESTGVIALYLERVREGRQFLDVAREVGRRKRIVALKGGRTAEGRTAAQSHTRSVAGRYAVFQAACRKCGIIRADNVTELYDYAKAAATLRSPRGRRLAVITSSGGSGILATDAAVEAGLEIAGLTNAARDELRRRLPPHCVVSNPLDLTGDASAQRYTAAAEAISTENQADAFLLIFGDPIGGALEAVDALRRRTPAPVAAAYIGGGQVGASEALRMQQHGIPVFPTPERAARAMAALLQAAMTEVPTTNQGGNELDADT